MIAWPTILLLAASGALAAGPQEILARRCGGCHNVLAKAGNLILDKRPPNPARLVERVEKGEMPPGQKLPSAEVAALREWVAAGAPWDTAAVAEPKRAGEDWWSIQPLRKAAPGDSIDSFLHARLAEKELKMNPEADRRTLIRRVTFDLLGLPPTPEEADTFVADDRPDAWERLIDRLLASPHYGERWGRHWLDVARFGESDGYEKNLLRDRAWPYRDWVIRSLNEDKSFRQMVLEQLAGDTVAPGNMNVEAATGFLVAGTHDTVKIQNIDGERQKRANDLDDMVIASGAGLLGFTIGCARCHDHKFDPIRQADYYRLAAVFDGVWHGERDVATKEERALRAEQEAPLRAQLSQVQRNIDAAIARGEPDIDERRVELSRGYRPSVDSRLTVEEFMAANARFVRLSITRGFRRSSPSLDEVEVFAEGKNVALGAKVTARSTRSTMDESKAFYLPELLTDGRFDRHWISGEPGRGEVTIDLGTVREVSRVQWSRDRNGAFQGRFLNQVPIEYTVELSLDGKRWSRAADSSARIPYGDTEQRDFFLAKLIPEYAGLIEEKAIIEKKLARLPKFPTVFAGSFEQPAEPLRLNRRGNPMDLGEEMRPGSPPALERMLPGFELDPRAPEAERRRALAGWLTDDRNALTARVLANRVWHYHFGHGIVGTPSDFGYNGERPTHPELLDHLAARLIHHGWKLKPLHREILLTAAYRQSAATDAKAAAIDSEARLLWRFPPRRLDGESLRDAILAVSGNLDRTVGGPGFRLYRYTVDNVATFYPLDHPGKETYRRAVYHQWARSVKDDMLSVHDCPESALPEPRRVQTTTALQALSLMNSPFLIDQAQALSDRVAGQDRPVEQVYRLLFGRAASEDEIAEGRHFADSHGFAALCRVLLNSNEFAYVF